MAAKPRSKYIKKAYSKGTLRNYTWNKDIATVFPDFSFQAVLDMIDNDPVARGAINHFVDKCMEGDYNIVNRKTLNYDRQSELTLDEKYEFRQKIIRKLFLMGKLFNNAFIEIIRNTDKTTKSLNVLDTLNVDPITEPNGDPLRTGTAYKSKIPDAKTGKHAEWVDKDITWLKFGDRTTGFAPVDMKALYENLCIKDWIKRYVGWLWQTGQYRILYNFKTASDADVENVLSFMKRHDNDFKTPFPMKGDMEVSMLRDMTEQQYIEQILKYWDGQTLILLRIPPIDAGIPDASGRSSSDAQSNNLSTTVTSFKKVIEDKLNFDLFPKISKGNSLIRFAPNDRFSEKAVFENLQIMQSLGMSKKVMQEYLADRGMFYKSTLFEPVENQPLASNPRNLDTMPSRTGKGTGEASNKIGTGEQATTREDQLKK